VGPPADPAPGFGTMGSGIPLSGAIREAALALPALTTRRTRVSDRPALQTRVIGLRAPGPRDSYRPWLVPPVRTKRLVAEETEPYSEGLQRILGKLTKRIGREEVTLMEGNVADFLGERPSAIVYDPTVPSHRSTGSPLLITALCADRTLWPAIHAAFAAEGFDPLTPEPGPGRVCYASRSRALLIVPAHPEATRAADQTGRALLTSIIR
jgi:hypothetical protein